MCNPHRRSRRGEAALRSRSFCPSCARPLAIALLGGLGPGLGLAGCGGLEPPARYEPITDPAQLYMRLTLDHRAVNLSTVAGYTTLQLTATPRDAAGQPMAGLPAPTFRLNAQGDSTSVWVTPAGELQARGVTTAPVLVIAELAALDNVRHADTARVTVNPTTDPPPLAASLSIELPVGDSAVAAMSGPQGSFTTNVAQFRPMWPIGSRRVRIPAARVLDAGGTLIPDLVVDYRSLDPTIARVDQEQNLIPIRPGQVRLVARTTVYGVSVADTLLYTLTWPIVRVIEVDPAAGAQSFLPAEVRLAPYGVVVWQRRALNAPDDAFGRADTVDVTFEDPAPVALPPAALCTRLAGFDPAVVGTGHCGEGNVLVPGLPVRTPANGLFEAFWTSRIRQFPTPGVYRYHSVRTGASGRIVVTADPDPAALP